LLLCGHRFSFFGGVVHTYEENSWVMWQLYIQFLVLWVFFQKYTVLHLTKIRQYMCIFLHTFPLFLTKKLAYTWSFCCLFYTVKFLMHAKNHYKNKTHRNLFHSFFYGGVNSTWVNIPLFSQQVPTVAHLYCFQSFVIKTMLQWQTLYACCFVFVEVCF
jgi:hypothetical protein